MTATATKTVDAADHGFSSQAAGRISLEELQTTAVTILEEMDVHDRLSACGNIRVPTRKPAAYGDDPSEARYMSGVCRCENGWVCPPCAFARQLETRQELEAVMDAWMDTDGWIYMVTLTVPHDLDWSLEELNRVLLDAWGYLKTSAEWSNEWRDRIGYAGCVRTYEVTHGDRNGWHPHIHAPFFCTDRADAELLEEFEAWATRTIEKRLGSWYRTEDGELRRWPMNRNPPEDFEPCIQEIGPGGGFRTHGVTVEGGQHSAGYLAKMGLSREISELTAKSGREGNRTMFEVLLSAHVGDDPADARIFREYARSVTGRSRWHWTPGFRDEVLPTDDGPKTEEELLEEEALREQGRVLCFRISEDLWDELDHRVEGNLASYLLQAYNSGGENPLDYLAHFCAAQLQYGDGPRGRVYRETYSRTLQLELFGPESSTTPWETTTGG